MKIKGETLNEVSELMLEMPYMEKFQQIVHFYKILDIIGRSDTIELLASVEYAKKRFKTGSDRITKIHQYLMKHYQEEIDLDKISSVINMAKGSLCRFFKSQMGITIFEYLNQIKVELACNLLRNLDLSILDVSYDSGFNNLSHFNKQFKKVTGQTPSEYRKQLKAYI
ncbi:MAG: AraC family transcriptional regulator, partial [Firmicutes bacterium]|nr:AraC family transcriptional regulator [Bacillota bacterium]